MRAYGERTTWQKIVFWVVLVLVVWLIVAMILFILGLPTGSEEAGGAARQVRSG